MLSEADGQSDRDTVVGIVEFVPGANDAFNTEVKASEVHGPASGNFPVATVSKAGIVVIDSNTHIEAGQLGAECDKGFKDVVTAIRSAEAGVVGYPDGEIEAAEGLSCRSAHAQFMPGPFNVTCSEKVNPGIQLQASDP